MLNFLLDAAAGAAETAESSPLAALSMPIMLIAMVAIFYFLMIRPQKKNAWQERCFRQKSAKDAMWRMRCWNIVWCKTE